MRYPNGELALYDVTFKVASPTFMAIIGPNGSGKSTFLKAALGLIRPSAGRVSTLGHDSVRESAKIRKLVRYVPQRDRIELSVPIHVRDIALMGRLLKKSPPRIASSKDKKAALDALEQVNMAAMWDRPFNELSGGQRQRVLVARALASDGPLLILDEPLAGTDAESQSLIVKALHEHYTHNNVNVVMVTHDLNPIHVVVRDVLLLRNTVIGIGQPCEVMDPELLKAAYGPGARIVEYGGHRYCVTHDSGFDRHD